MKKIFDTILMAAFLGFNVASQAANFSVTCPQNHEADVGCWIDLHGEIVDGDANKLLAIVSSKPKSSDMYRWLVLDSPGGDVAEALKLAKVVRDAMLRTQNYSASPDAKNWGKNIYVCASSCVIVAMSGVERVFRLHNDGGIGLHRPYIKNASIKNLPPSKIAEAQNMAMRSVREFFVAERMPQRLIDEMMNRSSRDVYWMTTEDYLSVPDMSAWYEEILISQCQYDPSVNERYGKAVRSRNEAAINATKNEMIKTARCSRTLTVLAQKKLQSS